ncbi:MAG: ComEA family DNA-binding protein [Ruminococcus sp.]
MKKLIKRPEAILIFFGLLFIAISVTFTVFYREVPNTAGVYYVSDYDKERLLESSVAETVLVDINTAGKEALMTVPGIGEVIAQRIIDYREQIGRFNSVEELMNIKGIGESTFENIKIYVKV